MHKPRPKTIHNAKNNSNKIISLFSQHRYSEIIYIHSKPQIIFETTQKAIKWILKYPLDEFLQIKYPRNFCCPFHDDKRPSASIYISNTSEKFLMTCNGACSTSWDIIGIVKTACKIEYGEALKVLFSIFNITVLCSNSKITYNSQLIHNISVINNLETNIFPNLFKLLQTGRTSITPKEIILFQNQYALELHINKQDLRNGYGRPIFFISISRFCELISSNERKVIINGSLSSKITALCYAGLLSRIDDTQLSKKALEIAEMPENDYRKNNKRFKNSRGNRISFYTIPFLTEKQLNFAEERAKRWFEKGYSISNTGYFDIAEKEGNAFANQIFAGRYIESHRQKQKQLEQKIADWDLVSYLCGEIEDF